MSLARIDNVSSTNLDSGHHSGAQKIKTKTL